MNPRDLALGLVNEVEYGFFHFSKYTEFTRHLQGPVSCETCSVIADKVGSFLTAALTDDVLDFIAIEICDLANVEGGERDVCQGAVKLMSPFVLEGLAQGVLSSQRVCNEHFHFCPSPTIQELSEFDYIKAQLASKPDKIKNNTWIDEQYKIMHTSAIARKTIRSVQLSDLHPDFEY